MSWRVSGQYKGSDPDAYAYIAAVEQQDNQALEYGVKVAINNFVVGCKDDGIWDAIKASCILAGARTLAGALVPLVGTAPTNFNFVSGDYDRKTGLKADGSTKYLDSNSDVLSDPVASSHISVYQTQAHSGGNFGCYIGSSETPSTQTQIAYRESDNQLVFRSRDFDLNAYFITPTDFIGLSRSSNSSKVLRNGGVTSSYSVASITPTASRNFFVFAQNNGTPVVPCNGRLSFYSIGESLDLALLDTRTTRFMAEMQFAINTGLNPSSYDIDTLNYVNAGYAAGGTLA